MTWNEIILIHIWGAFIKVQECKYCFETPWFFRYLVFYLVLRESPSRDITSLFFSSSTLLYCFWRCIMNDCLSGNGWLLLYWAWPWLLRTCTGTCDVDGQTRLSSQIICLNGLSYRLVCMYFTSFSNLLFKCLPIAGIAQTESFRLRSHAADNLKWLTVAYLIFAGDVFLCNCDTDLVNFWLYLIIISHY